MNHVVTIHAGSTGCAAVTKARIPCSTASTASSWNKRSAWLTDCRTRSVGDRTVVRAVVALGTQEGGTRFQQRRDVGTVRSMATGAVFSHGLMFPEEGTTFFGMAGEAGFINRVFLQQLGTSRAMRVVAVGANHLAFTDGVVRNLVALGTLLLMAGKTDLGLGLFIAYFIVRRVNLVARGARYIRSLVGTALPVGATLILGMARKAGLIQHLGFIRGEGAFLEDHVRRRFTFLGQMLFALAVATGAGGCAAVGAYAVFRLRDAQNLGAIAFVMTSGALGVASQDQVFGAGCCRNR